MRFIIRFLATHLKKKIPTTPAPPAEKKRKKRRLGRVLLTLAFLLLLALLLPQIFYGVTGLAIIKEVMTGEYETINTLLDRVLGRQRNEDSNGENKQPEKSQKTKEELKTLETLLDKFKALRKQEEKARSGKKEEVR